MAENEATLAPDASAEDRELGTMPIPKLFIKYSAIALVGMIAQVIMVILEGFIMGTGLGAHGLACVSIIMSVELMNVALGSALGVGVSTVVGSRLGSGDTEGARKALGQGFWLTTIIVVTATVLVLLFTPQVVTFLGATPDILDDAILGIRVFMVGIPFCVIGQMLTAVLRVDEKPQISSGIQMISAIIAVIWLASATFVFKLGVAGAGVYYALSIGIWAVVIVYFIGGKRSALYIKMSDLKLDAGLCLSMIKIGAPLFLLQAASSVYTTVVNNQLGALGSSLDIAAFAVINGYVVYILMMLVNASTFSVQPIAAYNAGAKAYGRLRKLIETSMVIQGAVLLVITALVWLAAYPICGLFSGGDAALAATSAEATRIVILACALGYSAQLMSTYFESIEHIAIATVLGLSRYVFFTIPAIFILGNIMGVTGVWVAQPVADVLTFVLTALFMIREIKRLKGLEAQAA